MGFLNLIGLVYLLSVPALIYIYYFSLKKKRVEISSIIPWRRLREHVVRSSLFRADLLFYCQLVLLLLLAAAACRPYWQRSAKEEPGRHVVIVLDRSASMQAMEGRRSRFELARDRALKLVRRLRGNDRVTLITAGVRPEVRASATMDHARVEALIGGLGPSDVPDRMAPALQIALGLVREGERAKRKNPLAGDALLHVFTDRTAESLGVGNLARGSPVELERVGSPKANAALTSIAVYKDLFSPQQQVSAYVTVENLSAKPFAGLLKGAVQGKTVAARSVTLEPGAALTTKVGEQFPEGVLEIALEPPDALPLDNRGYALLAGRKTVRIVLFTREPRCAAQFREIASAIPHLTLDVLSPDAYGSTDMASYQAAIFHGCEPMVEPVTNMLIIFPSPRSRIINVKQELVPGVSFLDWDEDHPLGENLRGLQNVPLAGARLLEVPSWARTVVRSATTGGDMPLVLCGEYRGRRTVITSFDMCDIELTKSNAMPALLLLLNALRWLAADERDGIKTGEAYTALLPAGGGYTVISPLGREERLNVTGNEALVYDDTDQAGQYLVSGGAVRKRFVANLCSRAESDLREEWQGEDRVVAEEVASVGVPPREPPDRSALFFGIALLLLLAEWLIFSVMRPQPAQGESEP